MQVNPKDLSSLVKHKEAYTGDELPYWCKAMPSLGLLAVAIGSRLELWRLSDLSKIAMVIEVCVLFVFVCV